MTTTLIIGASKGELDVRFVHMDVTDDISVTAAVDAVRAASGRVDVLVTNAGLRGARKPAAEISAADVREALTPTWSGWCASRTPSCPC